MIAHDPARKLRIATIIIIAISIWFALALVLTSYASAAPEDVFGHIPRYCDLFYSIIGDANYRIQNYELAYINGEWYIGYTVYRQVSGVWGHYTNGLLVAGQAYPETWNKPLQRVDGHRAPDAISESQHWGLQRPLRWPDGGRRRTADQLRRALALLAGASL